MTNAQRAMSLSRDPERKSVWQPAVTRSTFIKVGRIKYVQTIAQKCLATNTSAGTNACKDVREILSFRTRLTKCAVQLVQAESIRQTLLYGTMYV